MRNVQRYSTINTPVILGDSSVLLICHPGAVFYIVIPACAGMTADGVQGDKGMEFRHRGAFCVMPEQNTCHLPTHSHILVDIVF